MKPDWFTKTVLLAIAIFLGIITFKPAAQPESAFAAPNMTPSAISEFQKFDVVFVPAFSAQGELDTRTSNGWKAISITSYKDSKNDGLFILFGK